MENLRGITKACCDCEWASHGEYSLPTSPADIHCVSFKPFGRDPFTLVHPTKDQLMEVISQLEILIMHNGLCADLPAWMMAYGLEFTCLPDTIGGHPLGFIDTLCLSRASNPDRQLPAGYRGKGGAHSLDAWGFRVGRWKPEIKDWKNLSIDEYVHRCEEDVHITELTYQEIIKELRHD